MDFDRFVPHDSHHPSGIPPPPLLPSFHAPPPAAAATAAAAAAMRRPPQWITIDSKTTDADSIDLLKQSFQLYKNRPLKTPRKTMKDLNDYYPCNLMLLISNNKVIGGLMWWQTDYGNKISTSFSETPDIYKKHIIPKYYELLTTPGYYAELSDAVEYLLRKRGLDNIKDTSNIKELTRVTDADIFDNNDRRRQQHKLGKNESPVGSYLRDIQGLGVKRKALYGIPCMNKQFVGKGCFKKCKIHARDSNGGGGGGGGQKNGGRRKTRKRSKRGTHHHRRRRKTRKRRTRKRRTRRKRITRVSSRT